MDASPKVVTLTLIYRTSNKVLKISRPVFLSQSRIAKVPEYCAAVFPVGSYSSSTMLAW